jgi:hypothetical protein
MRVTIGNTTLKMSGFGQPGSIFGKYLACGATPVIAVTRWDEVLVRRRPADTKLREIVA